jgi:nucleoside-diphosphate-sugar epimerase
MRVLILGGTKFSGLEAVKKISLIDSVELVVASRTALDFFSVRIIDRKSYEDLKRLFKEPVDLVIDTICFTKKDAQKLIEALRFNGQCPPVLMVSSTYVYCGGNKFYYDETDFNPKEYNEMDLDWPDVNYIDGKRSAESFLVKNYPNDKLVILRFPVILGKGDPTGRTDFLIKIISERIKVNLIGEFSGRANFISKYDVAQVIACFVKKFKYGIYNVAIDFPVNQAELLELFSRFILRSTDLNYLNEGSFVKSPFFYSADFIVNTNKFAQEYNLRLDWGNLENELGEK